MASGPDFTAKEVAAHNTSDDCWMTIQGQVYDVTKYIHDHPGGADILIEAAGKDATVDFDNAGHSEDAFEIMEEYRVGKYKGAPRKDAPKRVTLQPKTPEIKSGGRTSAVVATAATAAVSSALALHQVYRFNPGVLDVLPAFKLSSKPNRGLGFFEGFILASALFTVAGTYAVKRLSKFLHFEEGGFMSYPPHKKMSKVSKPNPLIQRGWLDPSTYHALPLTEKELIAPNVYRLVFALPTPTTVLGLPIGQHLSIKADTGGKSVNRSYTPISNNSDLGTLELVIECYPDGQLTGGYLANVEIGDEVLFRGPKGAMRYQHGLCKKIGMLAGGTGITPMFQIIRAICEDDRDLTEVSLIYANRSEEDILLRKELESFARRYPQNFKLYYLLDNAPADWKYGTGYVTQELMAEKFPAPGSDSKVMLCGPPGMVSAAKKSLVNLGFEKPGASAKMMDQVFCF
ncbi:hypothetical protein LCI18_012754 [Fusarium solani-melongenae]|uniref:Uncharacterized protein n=1 Tax=Fusarium solani subsp. cucurbitae TaxID=2747967 RepID=A0ACD3ZKK4_FUSSC|nr:hypothetical protein LCI18_012754 [Fusarium solani-melongenae]